MADEVDLAADHMERELAALMASRRATGPHPTGFCLFCAEPLEGVLRFCGPDCRDGFDAEEKARARRMGGS
jgi:hypothetical protein